MAAENIRRYRDELASIVMEGPLVSFGEASGSLLTNETRN